MVGIDLGTTFTAAAVHRNGRTEIASLGNRAATVPSLVFLREDQTILVGEAAERRGLSEPRRLAREFKRRVGDSAPIMLGEAPYSAERLMAVLLKQVVAAVAEREGGPPRRVAVSYPANWGPFKTDLLRHAVDLAGLRGVSLLTEPVAAATHYASTERVDAGGVVAVYDLGGGTFDAAVLQKTATGFATLGDPEGIERLGGIDFDEAVFTHVRRALGGKAEELDSADPAVRSALVRLRQECVAAKEALSFDSDTTVSVMLPNVQTELRITRADFEPMIRPAIGETIEALDRALERARVEPDQLAAVLLVGGSSRIPLVAEMVSDALGRPVAVDTHPKHAVALGAALAAAAVGSQQAPPVPSAVPPEPSPPATDTAPTPHARPRPASPATPPAGLAAARSGGRARRPPSAPRTRRSAEVAGGQRRRRSRLLVGGAAALLAVAGAAAFYAADAGGEGGSDGGGGGGGTDTTGTDRACTSASGRCSFITGIDLDGDRYLVDYEAQGFEPLIFVEGSQGSPEDHHVHFFFDTTAPENAGTNGDPPGDWQLWDRHPEDGSLRFDELTASGRGGATQMCIAVADATHAVEADSGNCVELPGA